MAVFEKKVEVTGKDLYNYLDISNILYSFCIHQLRLKPKDIELIDKDVVFREMAEYILNKEREV